MFRLALVPLALCLVASIASAATNVSGTLWLSVSARAKAVKAPAPPKQPGVGEGVVWVETIPAKVENKLASGRRGWFSARPKAQALPSVAEREDAFAPRVVAVPAGGSVEFANRDRLYHSTFSVSGAKRFDLGKRAPGHRDTLAFERAGVINLHCEIHPEAVGFVVVTPNHAYATPDSAGHFSLPKLPPGHYVLRAWHPRRGELELPFDVPKRGAVVLDPTF
jgi:plastocyanin